MTVFFRRFCAIFGADKQPDSEGTVQQMSQRMSQRIVSIYAIPVILFALAISILSPAPVAAQDACAEQVGAGVLCDGPREVTASFLPLIQSSQIKASDRECPDPVDGGVLCYGPDIPDGQPASAAQSPDPSPAQQLYIPLLGGW
jgi:hypothetical protein